MPNVHEGGRGQSKKGRGKQRTETERGNWVLKNMRQHFRRHMSPVKLCASVCEEWVRKRQRERARSRRCWLYIVLACVYVCVCVCVWMSLVFAACDKQTKYYLPLSWLIHTHTHTLAQSVVARPHALILAIRVLIYLGVYYVSPDNADDTRSRRRRRRTWSRSSR